MKHRIHMIVLLAAVLLLLSVPAVCFAASSKQLKQKKTKDGNNIRVDYVDENGTVTYASDKNYATVVKTLDENGNVVLEYYYDEQGTPALQKSGCYGVQREYDEAGQNNVEVFLNTDGRPMINSSGYAKRVRTYDAEGKIKSEFYYDTDGKPIPCWRGYWGYRKEEDRTIYLGPGGIPIPLPHLFLQRMPYVVAAVALILLILPVFLPKKFLWILLPTYIFFIVYMTLMFRRTGSPRGRFELFRAYRSFFTSPYTRRQIIYNILLFVPLGSILVALKGKTTKAWLLLLFPVLLSFVIECTQYFTGLGMFELDDIFNNGMGGAIGFLISAGLAAVVNKVQNKLHTDKN